MLGVGDVILAFPIVCLSVSSPLIDESMTSQNTTCHSGKDKEGFFLVKKVTVLNEINVYYKK